MVPGARRLGLVYVSSNGIVLGQVCNVNFVDRDWVGMVTYEGRNLGILDDLSGRNG